MDSRHEIQQVLYKPGPAEKWHQYVQIFGGGEPDPMRHTVQLCQSFLNCLKTAVDADGEESGSQCQLFVGALAPFMKDTDLHTYFEGFGEVESVILKKGFGFVTFVLPESVETVLGYPEKHVICGQPVDCKIPQKKMAVTPSALHGQQVLMQQQRAPGAYGPRPTQQQIRPRSGQPYVNMIQQNVGPVETGVVENSEVFVGGIGHSTSDEDLRTYFSQWGAVTRVDLKPNKGFAFVKFERPESVSHIVGKHHMLEGRVISVKRRVLDDFQQAKSMGLDADQYKTHVREQAVAEHPPLPGGAISNRTPPSGGGAMYVDKIFVGGLPHAAGEQNIMDVFAQFGAVNRIDFKEGRGFCFIHYQHPESVDLVISQNGTIAVGDQYVNCKRADDRKPKLQVLRETGCV